MHFSCLDLNFIVNYSFFHSEHNVADIIGIGATRIYGRFQTNLSVFRIIFRSIFPFLRLMIDSELKIILLSCERAITKNGAGIRGFKSPLPKTAGLFEKYEIPVVLVKLLKFYMPRNNQIRDILFDIGL